MSKSTFGISADGFWLYAAPCSPDNRSKMIDAKTLGTPACIPNAILLPRFPQEPFRMDIGTEPHPRGSGLAWPVEAIVHQQYGAGRVPLGTLLERIGNGDSVEWETDASRSHKVSNAIADSLGGVFNSQRDDVDLIFVIPNHWNESLQQSLIEAFQHANINAKLLWRPVAAAIEWCEQFSKNLDDSAVDRGETVGKLLSLYIGFDTIEVTELELVLWGSDSGDVAIIPARKRPRSTDRIPSFGLRQAIEYIEKESVNSRSSSNMNSDTMSYVWNRLWCSMAISDLSRSQIFYDTSVISQPTPLESFVCRIEQLNPGQILTRLQQCRKTLESNYSGIAISGALANCEFRNGTKIWKWCLDGMNLNSDSSWIEGYNCENGLLARGAGWFGNRLAHNQPTYLDTLPRLEMVIADKGEPTWIDLLDPEQKWVDGGRMWHRPERILNLSIGARSIDLKLAVAHEEFSGVRELVTDLPDTAESTEKVSLSVQMFPAQGNARIEIHPDRAEFFKNQRLFVDWKKMTQFTNEKGKALSKQEYLDNLPRSFPELLPRLHSPTRWRSAKPAILRLHEMIQRNDPPQAVGKQLVIARNLIRDKDQSMYPQDATAFDSEGRCGDDFNLQDFMEDAWSYFVRFQPQNFIRPIAYTHVNHKPFIDFILRSIESDFTHDDFVLAAGKCLRDPEHIARFINAFFKSRKAIHFNQTWWRALSEILRFRGNAIQMLSPDQCYSLIRLAGKAFKEDRLSGHCSERFRLACLVIVYTLRRRAFDDNFLDPESDLAEGIKNEFRQARVDARAGRLRLMGGSIDLSQQLQLIIDYVDRKGRGQLLIGDSD
jgi:hypothetical protein